MIRTLVSSADKNAFKSVISIFCCSVSAGNISLCQTECFTPNIHFAINCNNPARFFFAPHSGPVA